MSQNRNPEKIIYISGNRNPAKILIFQETKLSYISETEYSERQHI